MMNSNSKFLCLQQQAIKANKGRVRFRYLCCLCLVTLCSISYAQEGQGIAAKKRVITNQKKQTVNVMHKNGESWLVGPNGMTLYSLVKEKARLSTCIEDCAKNWPPLLIKTKRPNAPPGLEGKLDKVKRLPPDKRIQATYEGQQLHYWSRDKVPGDMTGDGIGGIWFVVRP